MNDPDVMHDLSKELDALDNIGMDQETLGRLIDRAFSAKELEGRISKLRKRLDERIRELMQDMDITTAVGSERRASLARRSFFGVAEGATEKEHDMNSERCLEFIIRYADNGVKLTTAKIKQALEVYLDEHPGEAVPTFIAEHESPVLRNSKK